MKHVRIPVPETPQPLASRHWHRLALQELRARRHYPAGTLDWRVHHDTARCFVRLALGVPSNQWESRI